MDDFTFWISLSLCLLLRPKFGLSPKLSQEVKSFFSFGLSLNFKTEQKTE